MRKGNDMKIYCKYQGNSRINVTNIPSKGIEVEICVMQPPYFSSDIILNSQDIEELIELLQSYLEENK